MMRGSSILLTASALAFLVSPLRGQIERTVGFHIGQVRSQQIWSGPISSEAANGLTLGVNVDVPTPVSVLSIRAEFAYLGRSSQVWDPSTDPERLAAARITSHYLSFPILGKLGFNLGPASAYVLAGPAFDQLLETQCREDLCRALSEEKPSVISVMVGTGVSIDYKDLLRGDLEVRLTEGLSNAYQSNSTGVRFRSLEFLVRACLPF